ncbi:hypothetical protein OG559_09945 [Micromonospora sp. NBC_01405]|uniref:hypothetical protein n=1 Tax=Micromonospora sp. NBC_01405 TaxID=2903589 RepID=UPI00324D92A7
MALSTGFLAIGLNIAQPIAQPFALDRAADFARPGLTGTYLGVYATAGGLVAAGWNTIIGYLADLGDRWHVPALPWLALALLAVASAAAIAAIRSSHPQLTVGRHSAHDDLTGAVAQQAGRQTPADRSPDENASRK